MFHSFGFCRPLCVLLTAEECRRSEKIYKSLCFHKHQQLQESFKLSFLTAFLKVLQDIIKIQIQDSGVSCHMHGNPGRYPLAWNGSSAFLLMKPRRCTDSALELVEIWGGAYRWSVMYSQTYHMTCSTSANVKQVGCSAVVDPSSFMETHEDVVFCFWDALLLTAVVQRGYLSCSRLSICSKRSDHSPLTVLINEALKKIISCLFDLYTMCDYMLRMSY